MNRLATNWDALLASAPLNKQAAVDASASGGAFISRKTLVQPWDVHTDICPPVRSIPLETRKSASFVDLTKEQIGRFTVIGLAATTNEKRGRAAWVVRCACGMFEHRTTKTLLKYRAEPEHARCRECDHHNEMRKGFGRSEFPKITVRK